jgi:prevent-host-death family protein
MKSTISKTEFKAKALEVLRAVEQTGQPILITDRGKPTVEIRPYRADGRSAKEILKNSVVAYDKPLEPTDEPWEVLK